jgi:TetR/AcrR family acrAB operon transcriptional repressor
MARRSKEDALATRHRLLDAAEHVFQAQGVSATSLSDIAAEAGATRGAVYWHFKDKADLFNAMMERVTLPMEDAMSAAGQSTNPLDDLRTAILGSLRRTVHDPQTRRVFEVATHKVEYVSSLCAVQARHLRVRGEALAVMKVALAAAARQQGVRLAAPSTTAAQGLYALVDGLIQNWLLDVDNFDLVRTGRQVVDAYLSGLGLNIAFEKTAGEAD